MAEALQQVKEKVQPVLDKIDNYLQTSDDPFAGVFKKGEEYTGFKRLHLFLAVLVIILMFILFDAASQLLGTFFGFVYPAYRSFKAIESTEKEDDTQWLIYWTVFAFFSFVEIFADIILYWFPFYFSAKLIFLIWCMYPGKNNGSYFVYHNIVQRFLLKHEDTIDTGLNKAHGVFKKGQSAVETATKQN